ncbi:MAG: GNAT family N-acetyltransferase [Dinoroseobacter sp.]|nr:GNAT family N-acetyltransferase [Dinoroseobacter sp.]
MKVIVRRAGSLDAADLACLLNEIAKDTVRTAQTHDISKAEVLEWLYKASGHSARQVAETETGRILGFQSIEPHEDLPPEACDIATFVRTGQSGLGIGSRLFAETLRAARELGYRWINATLHADNTGGLAYYQSRGFELYICEASQTLSNTTHFDRVRMRFDLD